MEGSLLCTRVLRGKAQGRAPFGDDRSPSPRRVASCVRSLLSLTQTLGVALRVAQPDETYLNLVMDFIPQTVYGMSRHYAKAKKTFPLLYMKVRLPPLAFITPREASGRPSSDSTPTFRAHGVGVF